MSLRLTRCPGSARARLAGLCVAAAVLAAAGCEPRSAPGGARGPRADRAREEAQKLAMSAVQESTKVGTRTDRLVVPEGSTVKVVPAAATVPVNHVAPAPSAAPAPPAARPQPARPLAPNVVIREPVRSGVPYPTEAEAEEDAVNRAREILCERLNALSPPVNRTPTASAVREHHVVKDTKKSRPPSDKEKELLEQLGLGTDRVYVEFDVQVTEEQVRELRSQDRVVAALRVMAGLAAVSLAGFLFLRLDEWSRGYLTSWLGAAAAVLVAGLVAVAFLVG